MRTSFRSITAFLVATFISLASLAAEADITVTDAIVRAVPPGTPNTAAYMTIRNGSATDRRLIRVDSPVAKTAELHNVINDNGVMKMRQVQEILVKAKDKAELKTGSYHIMLIDLKQKLNEGGTVPITLTFDNGSTVSIDTSVTNPQATMPLDKSMDHSGMKH